MNRSSGTNFQWSYYPVLQELEYLALAPEPHMCILLLCTLGASDRCICYTSSPISLGNHKLCPPPPKLGTLLGKGVSYLYSTIAKKFKNQTNMSPAYCWSFYKWVKTRTCMLLVQRHHERKCGVRLQVTVCLNHIC